MIKAFGPKPWLQESWDARAAANFICGGIGSGLIVFAALFGGASRWLLVGAVLVMVGLSSVWFEIGRPWRALHVFLNPQTSWMTREAIVSAPLLGSVALAWLGLGPAAWAAALLALAFVYCQGRIVFGAKGIPAWREPLIVPLLVTTGLAEGGALFMALASSDGTLNAMAWLGLAAVLAMRGLLWTPWRTSLNTSAESARVLDAAGRVFGTTTWVALAAALWGAFLPHGATTDATLALVAGVAAPAGGIWFKYTLITRAAYTQGFALARLPVRGARRP